MDMLIFAEKYAACLPIQMNTSNTKITDHMFNYETDDDDDPPSSPSSIASTCSIHEDDMEICSPTSPAPIFYSNC
jgi:hypothetical protein